LKKWLSGWVIPLTCIFLGGILLKSEEKGEAQVRKVVAIISVLTFCLMTTAAFAGGDKNRGSKGKGSVVRTQVSGKGQ
jgi:hypothetical protein